MNDQSLAQSVGRKLADIDSKLMALLGLELVSIAPGAAVVQMTVRADMLNGHGYCQGGLVFALADQAFAYACMSGNQLGVTLSANVIFSKPARLRDVLTAEAQVTVDGGRTAACHVTVFNQAGEKLAHCQGVNYRTSGRVVDTKES